jgi:hypothetical protein
LCRLYLVHGLPAYSLCLLKLKHIPTQAGVVLRGIMHLVYEPGESQEALESEL